MVVSIPHSYFEYGFVANGKQAGIRVVPLIAIALSGKFDATRSVALHVERSRINHEHSYPYYK